MVNRNKTFDILDAPEYTPKLRCSGRFLLLLLLPLLTLVLIIEACRLPGQLAAGQDELAAAELMQKAISALRSFRQQMEIPVDLALDPNDTGMIGLDYTDLTTTVGSLTAKRTSCNPAFAGIIARMLHESGVAKGDKVALSLTGSFPALDVAALAACTVMELDAHFISSVGSSTYGANIPGFTWLDMEKYLYDHGYFSYLAKAISYGGVIETGGGIDGTGLDLAQAAVDRHGSLFLVEGDYRTVEAQTIRRKAILDDGGRPACYINVGGGLTALGWVAESARLDNGLLRSVPPTQDPARGLVFRYMEEGVPVIHMLNIERLAQRYGLPADPIPLPDATRALHGQAFTERFIVCATILIIWAGLSLLLLGLELQTRSASPHKGNHEQQGSKQN